MRPTAPRITILIVTGLLLVACGGDGSKPTAREPARPLPNQPASRIVTTTEARTITTEATTTTMPEPVRTTVPRTEPRRVADEPAGLFCRDLNAIGYSYSEAVAYWTMHEYPDRMDADLDGIPCETVYARADVIAHWGEAAWNRPLPADLPSGLFCRDLHARGIDYPEAVAYWLAEGAPDRMDADLDGVPCETVYPRADVEAYWGHLDPRLPVGLPSGLFCRDLHARGIDYRGAVAYWEAEGRPDRMDADLDGIPCGTVYPNDEVRDHWNGR